MDKVERYYPMDTGGMGLIADGEAPGAGYVAARHYEALSQQLAATIAERDRAVKRLALVLASKSFTWEGRKWPPEDWLQLFALIDATAAHTNVDAAIAAAAGDAGGES